MAEEQPRAAYVFGFGELPVDRAQPRGGTSQGAPVVLAEPRSLPSADQAARSDSFSRDRAAILALAGDFKVSFHFLETVALDPEAPPMRPYHSWATEHVRVIEDTRPFISLQHTLVMFFREPDGSAAGPMFTKHWRQDWTYEPQEMHTFRGDNTWARRTLAPEEVRGAWSQSVWQVDDSPRYAALGRWSHDGNRTLWTGETAWRPLPRREFSVRRDYDVLEGVHRIVLTPTGWVHEQFNWKRVTGETASPDDAPRFVGEEWGLDRYERITAPSLAAADAAWDRTDVYWAAVRAAWAEIFATHDHVTLRREVDGRRMFEEHFAYASQLEEDVSVDPVAAARHAREIIARYLRPER